MIKELISSLRAILVLTVVTGLVYPFLVTGVAQLAFSNQANGSLVRNGNQIVGSALLAQKFTDPRHFWPRPSAADYATVASGASNQGFTSKKLLDAVNQQRTLFGSNAPADLLYASGSGLDPDISSEAAAFQVSRVATARGIPVERLAKFVQARTEGPQYGFLGQSRVNVLLLNQALDGLK